MKIRINSAIIECDTIKIIQVMNGVYKITCETEETGKTDFLTTLTNPEVITIRKQIKAQEMLTTPEKEVQNVD